MPHLMIRAMNNHEFNVTSSSSTASPETSPEPLLDPVIEIESLALVVDVMATSPGV